MSRLSALAVLVVVLVTSFGVGAIAANGKKCAEATVPPSGCSDITCGATPCAGAVSAKKSYEGAGKCIDNPETDCEMVRVDPYCCASTCGWSAPNCQGFLACFSFHYTTLDCEGDM